MKNNKMYIYPLTARFDDKINNPYIWDLINSLDPHFDCVNKNNPSKIGFLNVARYFFKTKYFHLNWIEDLPDKKGGYLQTVFLLFMLLMMKVTGKKIIWTAHNKASHHHKNLRIKKFLIKFMARNSDYILTHSNEGVDYVMQLNNGKRRNAVKYIPHPVKPKLLMNSSEIVYDIIIWGYLARYKGIHLFLQYLKDLDLLTKYRILIAGRVFEPDYKIVLEHYLVDNIILIDRFVDASELQELIGKSRIILFTHQQEYVLSSGALMDSLAYGKTIIGPEIGAFKDLSEEGLVHTYQDFSDLVDKVDHIVNSYDKPDSKKLMKFIEENRWDNYGNYLYEWFSKTK